jgi:hypothetical protein
MSGGQVFVEGAPPFFLWTCLWSIEYKRIYLSLIAFFCHSRVANKLVKKSRQKLTHVFAEPDEYDIAFSRGIHIRISNKIDFSTLCRISAPRDMSHIRFGTRGFKMLPRTRCCRYMVLGGLLLPVQYVMGNFLTWVFLKSCCHCKFGIGRLRSR